MECPVKVGMTAYATKQGLGYLAKSFYDAGVISDVILIHHGSRQRPTHPEWYDNKAVSIKTRRIASPEVDRLLKRIDIMLFFETPFDWDLPARCRKFGVKTVMMPMYEWFPKGHQKDFDLFLCPSELDVRYFQEYPHSLFIPPVDPSTWCQRYVARKYLHNAGNVGHRQHKGTREVLLATQHIQSPAVITVRAQDVRYFNQVLKNSGVKPNPHLSIELGELPREELFKGHDVYVAPEKFNGLSLPLQEAFSSGMLVMASDRFPNTEWLPREPLIPVDNYHNASIGSSYLDFDEAEVDPKKVAHCIDTWYEQPITSYSLLGKEWAEEHSWEHSRNRLIEIFEGMLL